jgi:hypothetical protein
MKHFSIKYYILTFVLALLVYSCSNQVDFDKTRTTEEKQPKIIVSSSDHSEIFEQYNALVQSYKDGVYFQNWKYDASTNNITFDKKDSPEAFLENFNHKLGLGFKEHIAKENKKTLQMQVISPFASMDETGPYTGVLKVNGKPFSGVIVGTHIGSGQRILEGSFYEGIRVGNFNVWTNLNRQYTASFEQKIDIMDVETVRKPVIYLYPTQEQAINVKVLFDGKLTHTYPKYNAATGWNVQAQPDGMLMDKATGKSYSYLFWEGENKFQYNLNQGFVVKGEEVANFLDEKLEYLGLNRKEATDFVSYWLPEMEKNPYNLIHFSTKEYINNAPLQITPAPETLIRVFMVYQPLETPIEIPTQKLTKASRKGYTVVEWGGKKASEWLN